MIEKTEAIVLDVRPFSNTSLMVAWLTRDFGRIVTPVRGACRPKSAFLGQIDIGYRSELLFYSHASGDVHNIRETTPLDYRQGLHSNWRAAVAAGYLCVLTEQTVDTLFDSHRFFEVLDRALTELADGKPPHDIIVKYEFALAAMQGISPNFSECEDCRVQGKHKCRFSITEGRLICPECSNYKPEQDTVALSHEVLEALAACQRGDSASDFGAQTALAVRRFLGMFLSHHLELPLRARRTALAWLG